MDSLYPLLGSTFDADPNKRKYAELELRKLQSQDGEVSAMFQIVNDADADMPVRQAAAIYVKNRIRRAWETARNTRLGSSSITPVGPQDRAFLKAQILPSLANVPERLRTHLLSTLLRMVATDFPAQWPELMPQIGEYVGSGDAARVHAGIRALLQVVQAFRWSDEDKLLDLLIPQTFPAILATATQLLESPSASSPEAGSILHAIVKTYARSTTTKLTAHQQARENIIPWGTLLLSIVQFDIDDAQLPDDPEEKARSSWWKAKKWAFSSLNMLFIKYGNPSQLTSDKKEYKPFAEGFVQQFAPEILRTYLKLASDRSQYLSDRATMSIFRFLDECVRPKATWNLLKPHVDAVVRDFALPLLCFAERDQERWEDDPIDYIRSQLDVFEESSSPVGAASDFVATVVTKRKNSFMPQVQLINAVLAAPESTPAQISGALRMACAMDQAMVHDPAVGPQLDSFVLHQVVPKLKSEHGFLRFRACDTIKQLDQAGMQWNEEATLEAAFKGVMDCLMDSQLPVRVQAATALGELIAHEEVHAVMAPNAGRLMQELLKLSDETDLDVLMTTQEKVVEGFSEELLPFAVDLATQLRDSYLRMINAMHEASVKADAAVIDDAIGAEDGGEMAKTDEDRMFAAMANLATMYQLINAAENKPDILAQVEQVVLPAIIETLQKQMVELLDDLYDLVDMLTFYQKRVSPQMWTVFELTHYAFLHWAPDYLSEMVSTLDNMVSFGAETFRQNAQYRNMLAEIFATATHSPDMSEVDHIAAFKLADVMLLVLKGCWDTELPAILDTVLPVACGTMATKVSPKVLKWGEIVVLDALIYSPQLTLQHLEAKGATATFLDRIASRTQAYTRVHECRACIFGLMGLLALPPAGMPESLQTRAPRILGTLIVHLANMPAVLRKRKELKEMLGDVDEEEEVDDGDEAAAFADDADVHAEANKYAEMLAQERERLRLAGGDLSAELDEDYDDDDEDDDAIFDSPLDTLPIYESFRNVMQGLQTNHADAFQSLTAALPAEQQQALHTVSQMRDEDLAAIETAEDDA